MRRDDVGRGAKGGGGGNSRSSVSYVLKPFRVYIVFYCSGRRCGKKAAGKEENKDELS